MTNTGKKQKVLATSWHPGGANSIVPVIKKLISENKVDVVVIGHQFSEKIFQNKDIDYKTIAHWGLEDVSLDSMIKLLQAESPNLVLTGTSAQDPNNKNVIEQTIALAAQKMGIKSLAVLDFWANYSLRFGDVSGAEKFKFLPDKIAIMDEIAEQSMLNEGFDKEKLVITGNPHFDDLAIKARTFSRAKKSAVRQKIGLCVESLIFYAANSWKNEYKEQGFWDLTIIDLINEVLESLPEKQRGGTGLVVKLHPRTPADDRDEIKKYIEENSGRKIKIIENIDTREVALASDLVLVTYSTVGVEAVYMCKPCISLQPGLKGEDLLIVSKHGIIPAGYTDEDCKKEVKKAILNKRYRKELLKRASSFKTDGKATQRVAELVYQMLV